MIDPGNEAYADWVEDNFTWLANEFIETKSIKMFWEDFCNMRYQEFQDEKPGEPEDMPGSER